MARLYPLFALTIVIAIFSVGTAAAQEAPAIESIEVALWPEYDRPAMLGLYLVRLEADAALPATVSLPLPEGVDEPHVVAAWFPDGRLDDSLEWEVQSQNGQRVVSATVATTGVWLEFYAEIEQQDRERTYSFQWPGGVSSAAFDFEVMHPVGASDVRVSPQGEITVGQDGLTYTRLDLGRLGPAEMPELEIRYRKAEPLPESASRPPSSAQPLALLEVALWPEFDRRDTLVIYRVQLPAETQLPAVVSLPIPTETGEPHAVATIGDDRNLYVAPYETDTVGDWTWVSVESDSLLLQLEYYAGLAFEGDRRAFSYYWPGGLAIDAFQYEVQRPPNASDLELTPAGVPQAGQDGLSYLRAALGPQNVDEMLAISFAYEKPDATLSIDAVAQQPTLERPATTQGGTPDLTALLPWILGGFGVLLAGVGLFMLLRMRGSRPAMRTPRRRKRRSPEDKAELESSPVYCHVCGSQASASDLFCRRCGTKLRN